MPWGPLPVPSIPLSEPAWTPALALGLLASFRESVKKEKELGGS